MSFNRFRVIIVEDERDLRDSLVQYLRLEGLDAIGVGSCLEFYRAIAGSSFSVAVVDLGLPDQSGSSLVEFVRSNTGMGVIILTARDGMQDRLDGYHAGADLYLVKPVDCRELASAIRNLATRLTGAPSAPITPEQWCLVRQSWHLVTPTGLVIPLTAREMEFLACLADSSGRPVKRNTLLATLGYADDEYANRAMDSLIRRLRRKIEGAWSQPSPIKTSYSVGYSFCAPIAFG